MGTAGLRKKVAVFSQPHYLEMFLQAVFDTLRLPAGATLVIGGDGRFHNDVAIQTIVGMAVAAGATHLIVGRDGLLSTPAASSLIRARGAAGGFLLTASHNPGGPTGDFGIKFNMPNGGQAPAQLTDAVYTASRSLTGYHIADLAAVELGRVGSSERGGVQIEVIDPVDAYARQMQELFDFDRIRDWLRAGHRIVFDAMHGITGPYARRLLHADLGAAERDLWHADPRPDFGGLHPDPNPVDCRQLVELCVGADAPDLAAASDGDGDRNMILAPRFLLSPGDSVAMLLANADCLPGLQRQLPGVARSMPTSRALDQVAAARGLPCYETPTGWRYFCNLLDAGRIGLCGEESFGTGSAHTREKDGLWAVLAWLSVAAARRQALPEIALTHWRRYGRHYYQRHDYDIAAAAQGDEVMAGLRRAVTGLRGRSFDGASVEAADDFEYADPVDGSKAARQGVRVVLADGRRMVFRLSGTGTSGATLRIYLEQLEQAPERLQLPTDELLAPLGRLARDFALVPAITGLQGPSARI
jgi:phosphoglucomutase